jgi:beta-N-acetylhexosaminidase
VNKTIGQLFFIGVSGETLTPAEKTFIIDNNIGGVVLFARNLKTPRQIHALCSEIQALRYKMIDKAPLFIGIDMEGGRVLRLKEPFTPWPALKKLGDLDNSSVTYHFANRMAMELKAVGINLDFAPCVDVLTNPKNTVIGDRALSHDFKMVDRHASALVRGYIKAGIISCAKHFPGHGNTMLDSHEALPIEETDLQTLQDREIIPFRKAVKSRVDMVMMAHILFPKIDPSGPATFSEFFIKKLVREDLRFKGIVISDDLDMKAMTNQWSREEIPVKALLAGIEVLLYCNDPTSPPIALDAITSAVAQGRLDKNLLEAAKKKVLDLKKDKLAQSDPMPFDEAIKFIGHPEHLKLASALAKGEVPAGLLPE